MKDDATTKTEGPLPFGSYVLHRRIAEGGMAEIFLAERTTVGDFSKVVVLKRMLPHLENGDHVKMFMDEARLASRLSHPNIVQVHDFGEAEGRYYLVMEYLAGETLAIILRRHALESKLVPPDVAIWIVRAMLDGLHHAHEHREGGQLMNVVHRDVSPSNVMVTYQGSVKVVDFGIARANDRVQDETATGVLKGKRAYASPEQYRGRMLDRRADIWATGVVLHELCTSERLFRKETAEGTMLAVLQGEILDPRTIRGDLPEGLYPIILKALARNPRERYETADEMSRELEALMTGTPPRIGEWMRSLFGDARAQEVLDARDGISSIERLSLPDEPTTPYRDLLPEVDQTDLSSENPTAVERPVSRSDTPPDSPTKNAPSPPPHASTPAEASRAPISGTPRRVRAILSVVAVAAIAVVAGYGLRSAEEPDDTAASGRADEATDASAQSDSYVQAFAKVQSGAHEEARVLLDAHLATHPEDADARVLRLFVQWWTAAPRIDTQLEQARAAALDEAQRVTVEGLSMVNAGRNSEAVAYLEPHAAEHPDRPELLYVLGEALWHGQQYRDGAATLARVIEVDPTWQIALHHTIDFYLDGSELDRVRALADAIAMTNPGRANALRGQALLAEQKYDEAVALLEPALFGDYVNEPHLWVVLAQAHILRDDHDTARFAVRRAFETWPVDEREVGGTALLAELALYHGNVAEFERTSSGITNIGRLMDGMWRGEGQEQPDRPPRRGILSPAVYLMGHFEEQHARGRDEEVLWSGYPESDLAALGEGLTREREGRHEEASAAYARGLEGTRDGWTRMLLSHHLARARSAVGDDRGAADACDAVFRPRVYRAYRALVLPDCEVFLAAASTPDDARAIYRRMLDRWSGSFEHPAIAVARAHLER